MKWDVFISHASEDKDDVVRPLAVILERYGVKVWFDEFELKIGDSLSKSIDRGLVDSEYGLVVISTNFLNKNWTDYELRSLIAKEVHGKKVILPIWHNITKNEIMKYSLFLVDKFALSTDGELHQVAYDIIKVIRPDIINSYNLKKFMLLEDIKRVKKKIRPVMVPFSSMQESPHMHENLPKFLCMGSKLFSVIFSDILDMGYESLIDGFKRDWDYDKEFAIWCIIATTYLEFIKQYNISPSDIDQKREILTLLMMYSMTSENNEKCEYLSRADINKLFDQYKKNAKFFMTLNYNLYSPKA